MINWIFLGQILVKIDIHTVNSNVSFKENAKKLEISSRFNLVNKAKISTSDLISNVNAKMVIYLRY